MQRKQNVRAAIAALLLVGAPLSTAAAQEPAFECDNRFGPCGTPEMSGGAGGGGGLLIAGTDLGVTYQSADDYDNDGLEDNDDNCPSFFNIDQGDRDGDLFGDACDVCRLIVDVDQLDSDGDRLGDLCDDDFDGDTILNAGDNCPGVPNLGLLDSDGDGLGDSCDLDMDGDGFNNIEDNCPALAASSGGACFPDLDLDGIAEFDPVSPDNCPGLANADQLDTDRDRFGDACDNDDDQDGFLDHLDNCRLAANVNQIDLDRDGRGETDSRGDIGCDTDGFCFAVLGNVGECLDPEADLDVYAPDLLAETGAAARLPIFVNRTHQPANYQWSVVSSPSGSNATVRFGSGSVTTTSAFEYVYEAGAVPAFTPDRPGRYELRLVLVTAGADNVSGLVNAQADTSIVIEAYGQPVSNSGNCSVAAPGATSGNLGLAGLAVLGIVLPLVRRRRR